MKRTDARCLKISRPNEFGEKTRKRIKLVLMCSLIILIQAIILGLGMIKDTPLTNSSFAATVETWDLSEAGDGSIIATLDSEGTLTIEGNGKMKDYTWGSNVRPRTFW